MCLTIPLKVLSAAGNQATLENGRRVNLLLDEPVAKGDWLLVKSDLAVAKLNDGEARAIRRTLKELS